MVLVDIDISNGIDDGSVNLFYSNKTDTVPDVFATVSNSFGSVHLTSYSAGATTGVQKGVSTSYRRFNGITIPQGSIIDNATLNQRFLEEAGKSATIQIQGLDVATPTVPTISTSNTGTFVFTGPFVSATKTTIVPATTNTVTPVPQALAIDVKDIVQELVNNFDYNNDSMLFTVGIKDPITFTGTVFTQNVRAEEFENSGISPNLTINYTLVAPSTGFSVDALLKALGENGACPIPATENFYSRPSAASLAFRMGGGLQTPQELNTRSGLELTDSTHHGKAIEDVQCRGMNRNGVGATGLMFATVRDRNDNIIAMSDTKDVTTFPVTIDANTLREYTFPNPVVLQEGYKILVEFPVCVGCDNVPPITSGPNIWWFGTAAAPPSGTRVAVYVDNKYTFPTGFTPGGEISFTTSAAVPGAQNGCASIDALLKRITTGCILNYSDDMTTPANWISTDTTAPFFVDIVGGVLDWESQAMSANITASNDFSLTGRLGQFLDDNGKWRIRWKAEFTTIGAGPTGANRFVFYVSDDDELTNVGGHPGNPSLENGIGIMFTVSGSSGMSIQAFFKDQPNSLIQVAGTLETGLMTGGQIRYCEIIRDSATSATWNVYSDAGFSTLIGTQTKTNLASSIVDLRYAKAGNDNFFSTANALEGNFDDLEIIQTLTESGSGAGGCISIDGLLVQQTPEDFTVDAVLKRAKEFSLDAKLSTQIDVPQVNMVVPDPPEAIVGTALIDAILIGTEKTYTVDGITFLVPSELITINAILQATFTQAFTVDAVIKALGDNASCQDPQTDFTETFSGYANQAAIDAVWVQNNASGFIVTDFDEKEINWNNRIIGSNNSMAYDLFTNNGITVSDTEWILRFKHDTTVVDAGSSTGKYLWIGLFDSDETVDSETTQDAIAFYLNIASGGNGINLAQRDGVILSNAGTNSTLTKTNTASDTYWVELKRESSTLARLSLYSDHLFTQLIESTTLAIPASLTGLRYIALKNRNLATTTGFLNGNMDDIDFWNGISTIPAVIETGITVECPTVDALIKSLGDDASCLATYSNAIDLASEWLFDPGGTGFFRLLGSGPIDFEIARNGISNDFASLDLDPPSGGTVRLGQPLDDTYFVARWNFEWTTLTTGNANLLYMGLSDLQTTNYNDQGAADQNALMITLIGSTGGTPDDPRWVPQYKNGTTPVSLGLSVSNLFTTGVKYGIEIRRNSATSATYTLYDSTFTTVLQTSTHTIPADIKNLQYFKSTNHDTMNGGYFVMDGEIDDFSVETLRIEGHGDQASVGSSGCLNIDAILLFEGLLKSFSLDALVQLMPSELYCIDACLLGPFKTTDYEVDALLDDPNAVLENFTVDAILNLRGEDGSCPSGSESVVSVLQNIDLDDTNVNTTSSGVRQGQRWTPTQNEVDMLGVGITKLNLWHGHTGGTGQFNTRVWSNAGVGTSGGTEVANGGNFFFFGASSGVQKRLRPITAIPGGGPWLPTVGVEYVLGIEELFPGTATTRKTAADTINGVFTTRSGTWSNGTGDWAMELTAQGTGLGQGDQNFCLGIDGRLAQVSTKDFTIDAVLIPEVVTNMFNFTVDGLLMIMPSKPYCVDAILQAFGLVELFEVDSLLDIPGALTENFTIDSLIKALGENGGCDEVILGVPFGSRSEQDSTFSPGIGGGTSWGEGAGIRFTPDVTMKIRAIEWNSTRGGGFASGQVRCQVYTGVPTSGNITAGSVTLIPGQQSFNTDDPHGGNEGSLSQFITFWSQSSQKRRNEFLNVPASSNTSGVGGFLELDAGTEYVFMLREQDVGTGWSVSETTGGNSNQTVPDVSGVRFEHWNNVVNPSTAEVLDLSPDDFAVDFEIETAKTAGCSEVDALLQSTGDNGCTQTTFIDNIGGNAGLWTEVDGAGEIEIDLASSGVLEWNNLHGGGTSIETFAYRSIPNFDDDIGKITLRLKVDKISSNIPTGRFMVLQNNNLHPRPSTGSSIQLGLGSGTTNGGIFAGVDDGTSGVTTTPQLNFLDGTTRYLEAVYEPVGQTLTLNVYTDAGFSVHDTGSPVQIDASSVSMTGLTFTHMITSNVKNSGPGRVVSADLDNFQVTTGGCPSFSVDAQLLQLITVQTADFSVDAILALRIAKDFTVDAFFNRQTQFIVDVSVAQNTGFVRDVGDLIVRVLFENDDLGGSGLTGQQVVDEIRAITEVELQWGFFGKTSRIRSWLNTLKFRGVVQEDGSDPDWYETIWTLV